MIPHQKYVRKLKSAQKEKEIKTVEYQLTLAVDPDFINELKEKLERLKARDVKKFKRINSFK